jgi:hypothetical protein
MFAGVAWVTVKSLSGRAILSLLLTPVLSLAAGVVAESLVAPALSAVWIGFSERDHLAAVFTTGDIAARLEAEKVERDLRNMAREHLLPDDKTLEKVARYEAHLSRGLYKALHELEAMQTRRQGGAAPLARLDVDGLVES